MTFSKVRICQERVETASKLGHANNRNHIRKKLVESRYRERGQESVNFRHKHAHLHAHTRTHTDLRFGCVIRVADFGVSQSERNLTAVADVERCDVSPVALMRISAVLHETRDYRHCE